MIQWWSFAGSARWDVYQAWWKWKCFKYFRLVFRREGSTKNFSSSIDNPLCWGHHDSWPGSPARPLWITSVTVGLKKCPIVSKYPKHPQTWSEKTEKWFKHIQYTGWYPVFDKAIRIHELIAALRCTSQYKQRGWLVASRLKSLPGPCVRMETLQSCKLLKSRPLVLSRVIAVWCLSHAI